MGCTVSKLLLQGYIITTTKTINASNILLSQNKEGRGERGEGEGRGRGGRGEGGEMIPANPS